ncbi:hypothetical protein ACB098_02G018600 [Castanea mollissima]
MELPPEPETDLNELKSSTCIQLRHVLFQELENSDHAALRNNCNDDGRFLHSVFCSLIVKAPLLAHNRFVEAIFILKDCRAHIGDANSHGSKVESQLFAIRANYENSRSERMHIYVSLLRQMAQEQSLMSLWS